MSYFIEQDLLALPGIDNSSLEINMYSVLAASKNIIYYWARKFCLKTYISLYAKTLRHLPQRSVFYDGKL
jgi:hypothetical protein